MEDIKRINLRLNLNDPIDTIVWNLVKDEKKKGTYIKYLLYNLAINNKENLVKGKANEDEEAVEELEIKLNDDGMNF
ncbi:hypothetical protein CYK68_14625 [Clostridium perfringens]|uniref:hypothetical protein n=1 Tax=Clostridium perfringens TaxID=1502 RepID=UPI000D8EC60A|nr:hypothetical protein [Clostridium perfringens]MCX0390781.1 hypothetical protein [Clostridium perfringens]PWX07309.1 hypothetical protein CYK68_14625 [Clostridium perfringens]PWX14713.1 hypothetical protein CYK66_14790 [Clostridium perfringens]HAT4259253.1 hypothetical protein [Clostridium perfringens]